jgi:RNA polymerase sigma-70 factor, ECF subfamily
MDGVSCPNHLRQAGLSRELPGSQVRPNQGTTVSDDAPLIEQTLKGDPAAFGQLVSKYQDRLFNALVHSVGHTEDARDIVQDAFVQAFVKLDTFHQTSAFYTWLYRIAFNVAASRRRKRKIVSSVEQVREMSGQEPVDSGAEPSGHLEQQERRRQVREALAQLSEEHRAILVLREMDGYDYEEIAEILELPVGTVRSRLHRARLQMRNQLKEVLALEEEP